MPIDPDFPASIDAICFVCTGNICRSPTAEVVLRSKLKSLPLRSSVQVCSAGTHGYHVGEPPDPRSIAVAVQRGYDLSSVVAKQFMTEDFARFELVLALDQTHRALLLDMAGAEDRRKIHLATCCSRRYANQDVPDPYYGKLGDFHHVVDILEDAADGLCRLLQGHTGPIGGNVSRVAFLRE